MENIYKINNHKVSSGFDFSRAVFRVRNPIKMTLTGAPSGDKKLLGDNCKPQ